MVMNYQNPWQSPLMKVTVELFPIEGAVRHDCYRCPVAKILTLILRPGLVACVLPNQVRIYHGSTVVYKCKLPPVAAYAVSGFDTCGEFDKQACTFILPKGYINDRL